VPQCPIAGDANVRTISATRQLVLGMITNRRRIHVALTKSDIPCAFTLLPFCRCIKGQMKSLSDVQLIAREVATTIMYGDVGRRRAGIIHVMWSL